MHKQGCHTSAKLLRTPEKVGIFGKSSNILRCTFTLIAMRNEKI